MTLEHEVFNGKKKFGSLQKFVEYDDVFENYSPTLFSKEQLQLIACFDIRTLNLDRNDCNLLVVKKNGTNEKTLVPIDHGLCFSENFEINSWDLNFTSWRACEEPMAEGVKEYIRAIDVDRDILALEQSGAKLRPVCVRNMRIMAQLLKFGADVGLSLAEIGSLMFRPDDEPEKESILEEIVQKCFGGEELAVKLEQGDVIS